MRNLAFVNAPSTSRYLNDGFVGWFVVRHFGPLVKTRAAPSSTSSHRFFGRFSEIGGTSEVFYQTVAVLLRHYVRGESACLDVGCGAGRITGELARLGARVAIGIDSSPLMVTVASDIVTGDREIEFSLSGPGEMKASVSGWNMRNCVFSHAAAEKLPIRDASIDVLVCANLLHRVSDPQVALAELARVIRPGGIALFSNSYDWLEEFTPQARWFWDVVPELGNSWSVVHELDGVPYAASVTIRKATIASNHVVIARKEES